MYIQGQRARKLFSTSLKSSQNWRNLNEDIPSSGPLFWIEYDKCNSKCEARYSRSIPRIRSKVSFTAVPGCVKLHH
jgi:hypothetical protein